MQRAGNSSDLPYVDKIANVSSHFFVSELATKPSNFHESVSADMFLSNDKMRVWALTWLYRIAPMIDRNGRLLASPSK